MAATDLHLRLPSISDGVAMWRLAQRAGKLDVNSSYAYLLWARDFAATSVVAVDPIGGGEAVLAGFISGYQRPDDPSVLFVWQVAVDPDYRRRGLAGSMLDDLASRATARGCRSLETTVTPDNAPSMALFRRFAARRRAAVTETVLFGTSDFPDAHSPEHLLHVAGL
jgi:L-2,4-diaminobutyric acid acetyltransferase